MATRGAVIVSPLATSMSSSRAGGSGLTLWASVMRRSVVWPIAETTATTWCPCFTVAQRLAMQRWALRHDRAHEKGGARGVECRVGERHLFRQHRTRLFRGQRLVSDEQREAPSGIRQLLVHLLRHDANAA